MTTTPNTDAQHIEVPDGLLDFLAELDRRGLTLRFERSVQLHADDYDQVRRLAERHGLSEADILGRALDALLDQPADVDFWARNRLRLP